MTAEKVGPMPFIGNSWARFFSVSLHVVGLWSRSCSIGGQMERSQGDLARGQRSQDLPERNIRYRNNAR
jgi:hypothetical protein